METVQEWKEMQPEDASCRAPDFGSWQQCPKDCPYNTGATCKLRDSDG
jgi:hypothetical protein